MSKNKKKLINNQKQPAQRPILNNGFESLVSSMPQKGGLFNNSTIQNYISYDMSITINWQLLEFYYIKYSFVRNLIDVPVDDAFSKGIEIITNELDDKDIKRFNWFLEENNVLEDIKQAIKFTRLFGGGGILINESSQDNWQNELILKNLKQGDNIKIYPVHRWELFSKNIYDNLNEITQYMPETEFYIRGKKVHQSRFYKMRSKKLPYPLDTYVQGWGPSLIETVMDNINMFIKSRSSLLELIDEAKIDIFYKEGLSENLATAEGENAIRKELSLTNMLKNSQNAIVMDILDKWEQKQVNYSGYAEMFRELRIDMCASFNMPATKLWGVALMSNLGMNNEGDMDNYNISLESSVRQHSKGLILYIYKIYMLVFFGFIPEDLEIKFPSLKIIPEKEMMENKKDKTNIALNLYDRGLLNSGNLEKLLKKEDIIEVELEAIPNIPESQANFGEFNQIFQNNSKRKEYKFLK